ncbi:aldehyde dehydrogenase family protein [Amnibacterium kyonggiense]|uniref:Aldehyde dehydrogenase family protein n=1 Tax=Amnibacterium kyonggiense TaxID=595671 RepID=A0A4R7FSM4_9MICO|nr:aldehyde dehydrogenase family protein [Amnibacterium kyonggiense]TDS80669.1 aldehyde dehydrogenase family protein [Amnibacterium kyonggiense]
MSVGTARASDDVVDEAALDRALEDLEAGATRWATTPLPERAALLRRTHAAVAEHAEEWALTAARVKGLDPASPLVGEEWLSGPYAALTALARLASTLDVLAAGRSPLRGLSFHAAPGGRRAVDVLPLDRTESLLLNGFRAEVWFPPGTTDQRAMLTAGLGALRVGESGGVGLVLGAGNITSIPPLDVLYEVVAHNRAAVLKLNPVLAELEGPFSRAFAPLVDAGLLRIVQGGAAVGGFLAHHRLVAHVHITGSVVSHDAIVWGTGEEAAERKRAGTPLLEVPITSELGGASPIIVVPGAWTDAELAFQAEHVATMRLHNGGYNCIAGQVLVVSADWPQRAAFLDAVRAAIAAAPPRPAWYPGSADRTAAAVAAYPEAERLGPDGGRVLVEVGSGDPHAIETTECFAPVLGVVDVPGTGQAFLDAAVRLANDDLVGTLGANVLIRPEDRAALGAGFGRAIAALRYGTIAINAWTGLGFLLAATPWGAFPGGTLADAGSGIGVVHNALLIDGAERTVLHGPFRPFPASVLRGERALSPRPPWFVTARTAATTGRLLTGFAGGRAPWLLPAALASAFRA